MPPKPDPAKDAKAEEKKGPPPAAKKYANEAKFVEEARKQMDELIEKVHLAGGSKDAKGKDAGAAEAGSDLLFNKDQCKQYIEGCAATWLEDDAVEDFWTKIEKATDKDGKVLESVTETQLRSFTLERTFSKGWITQSRFESALETAPQSLKLERYETVMLDFL